MTMLRRFIKNGEGATAVEYSLIATIISLGIMLGVGRFADSLQWMWSNNNSKIVKVLGEP